MNPIVMKVNEDSLRFVGWFRSNRGVEWNFSVNNCGCIEQWRHADSHDVYAKDITRECFEKIQKLFGFEQINKWNVKVPDFSDDTIIAVFKGGLGGKSRGYISSFRGGYRAMFVNYNGNVYELLTFKSFGDAKSHMDWRDFERIEY